MYKNGGVQFVTGQTRDYHILEKNQEPSAIVSYRNMVSPEPMPEGKDAKHPDPIPPGIYALAFVYRLLCLWSPHFREKVEGDLTVLTPDPNTISDCDIRITLASNGISFTACSRDEQIIMTIWGRDPRRILLAAASAMKAIRGYGMNRTTSNIMIDRETELRFAICMATFKVVPN